LWARNIQLDIPRSLYVGPLTSINTTCLLGIISLIFNEKNNLFSQTWQNYALLFLACAKGSCQVQLYDFWHSPSRQPAPSLIKMEQQLKTGSSSSSGEADEAVCENCIRKIVKSLTSPSNSGPMRAADTAAASSNDSVCLLPDMK
jgi:hypothetical protein